MSITTNQSTSPRKEALRLMEESLTQSERERNWEFVNKLQEKLSNHPLSKHPVLKQLNGGELLKADLQVLHLEYREAGVQIFTDALSMALYNAKQLEPRLAPGSKMAARTLLTLNCLDEFGFRAGLSESGGYIGSPEEAHYPLFEKLLLQLGLTENDVLTYQPSDTATNLKNLLEGAYDSYPLLLTLLAVAEFQVVSFSAALRNAVKAAGFDIQSGYYHVHGVSTDESCNACDDDHEEDLWSALVQGITSDQFEMIMQKAEVYLEAWMAFWTERFESLEVNQECAVAE